MLSLSHHKRSSSRSVLFAFLAVFTASLAPGAANAQSVDLFVPGPTFQVASGGVMTLVTDMNRDGVDDLVAVDRYGRKVDVWRGQPDGTFLLASSTATPGEPISGTIFQANGDGNPDVVVCMSPDNTFLVLLGDGSGDLTLTTPVATEYPGPTHAVGGDFDNDGDQDLAVSVSGSDNNTAYCCLYENTGTGWNLRACHFIGDRTTVGNLVTDDVDHDGDLDVIMGTTNGRSIRVIFNDGNWVFHTGPSIPTPSLYALGPLAAGDFNEDGKLDIASVNNNSHGYAIFLSNGDGTFTPYDLSVGAWNLPGGLAVGDFDRDCHLDIAVADYGNGSVSVLHGRGNGYFDLYPTTYAAAGGGWPAVGDFNRDGVGDLAISCGDGYVRLFLGQAVPYLVAGVTNKVSDSSVFPSVGDLNADGHLDYVVCDRYHQKLQGWLGLGDGTFHLASILATPGNPLSGTLFDANGDGVLDFVVCLENPVNKIVVYFGDGIGNFCPLQPMAVPGAPTSVESMDFDADGDQDLVLASVRQSDNMALCTFLRNNGGGSFQVCNTFEIGDRTGVKNLVVADFDLDGDLDAAMALTNGGAVRVLFNEGNCQFQLGPAWSPPSLGALNGLTGGDLDGDGDTDLVSLNNNSHGYAIFMNNGDGSFIVHDRIETSWQLPTLATVGDFDRDCVPDVLVCDYGTGKVSLLDGLGDGSFRLLAGTYDVASAGLPVVGDFDEDGVADALIGCGNGNVSMLLGISTAWPSGVGDPGGAGLGDSPPALRILPNPGGMQRQLVFSLPEPSAVELRIVDVSGRVVAVVHNGTLPAGEQQLAWNGRSATGQTLSSGVYFAEMRTARTQYRRAFTVIR